MAEINKNFRVKNGLEVGGDGAFEGTVTADSFQLDTAAAISPAVGEIAWDAENETLAVKLDDAVTLQVGQEHVIRVKNSSGSVAIPDRTLVMFAGATGDTVTVTPAISNDLATYPSEYLVGVTTEEIPADGFGFVTQFGFVNNVDTSAWTVGTLLYSDPNTPGGFVSSEPAAPAWKNPVGAVTKQNASSGRILVRAIPGHMLHSLSNVQITSPSNGQVLKYNGTYWVNGTDEAGSGGTAETISPLLLMGG